MAQKTYQTMLQEKIEQFLTDLADQNDDLLALLDDLWLEIDHTNAESIRKGSQGMVGVVELTKQFRSLRDGLTEKLRAFLPPPKEVTATQPDEETTRRLALFDGKETIGLADYWSYKKPFGFILKGRPYPRKRNWIDLYQKLCEVLRELDAERFDSIPDCREIISTHGKPYFSKDHHTLRSPMKVAEGVYAESNLSANLIRDNILRLLKIFEISKEKLTIYLRY